LSHMGGCGICEAHGKVGVPDLWPGSHAVWGLVSKWLPEAFVSARCRITTRQVKNTVTPDAFVAALRANGPVASWAREVSVDKGRLLCSGE